MRAVTATEKLRAVNEGTMAPKEFVRQMRQEFPQHITQFNGFKDSVQILKNRGLLFEAKVEEVVKEEAKSSYDERPALTYSLNALDRGIRVELEAKGISVTGGSIKAEDFYAAEKKAKDCLEKNPNHYLDLMAGESDKVDKHDKEVEYKKGNEVDVFNGMKKAELKEGTLTEGTRALVGYLAGNTLTTAYNHYDGYPSNLGRGLEAHYNDDDKAKDIAMKGYISYLDPETGEIEQTHKDPAKKITLSQDEEEFAREIAEEIDSMSANFGYIWDDRDDRWVTIKNTGIRSMIDQIMEKLGDYAELEEDAEEDARNDADAAMYDKDYDKADGVVREEKKQMLEHILSTIKAKYPELTKGIFIDYIKTHYNELLADDSIDILDDFEQYVQHNFDALDEKKLNEEGVEDANYPVIEAFKKYGIDLSRDVIVAEMDGGTPQYGGGKLDIGDPEPAMVVAKRLEQYRLDTIHEYESEDQMRDFPVMYEDGFYGDYTPEGTEFKLTYSEDEGTMWDIFQAPSGVSEKKGEGLKDVEDGRDIGGKIIEFAGGGMVDINIDYQRGKTKYFKDVPVEKAIDIVNQYIEQNDLTQASTYGTKRVLQVDDGDTAIDITRAGISEKKGKDHDQEIISYIADTYIQNAKGGDKAYAEFRDLNIRDAVQDVVGILQDPKHPLHGETKKEYQIVSRDKARGLFEKKGKDHDGDGDIDGDDYKSAKDKAIKKAMGKDDKKEKQLKEAIKSIIKKTLTEDTLNEAATQDLAKIADSYDNFDGLKPAVIALENIVTDIESFYDKTRAKIQKIYNDLGEIRNEEGLKVGAFIAPAIENAFKKDLKPITKHQFHGGLELPQLKKISEKENVAPEAPVDELEAKQTLYTPNF